MQKLTSWRNRKKPEENPQFLKNKRLIISHLPKNRKEPKQNFATLKIIQQPRVVLNRRGRREKAQRRRQG
jgi:hypothetical protein